MSIWTKKKLGVLALCLLPGAALAQDDAAQDELAQAPEQLTVETAPVQERMTLSCAFAQECYETEACQEAGYGFELTGRAGGMDPQTLVVDGTLRSETGDVPMVGVRSEGLYSLSGGGFEGRHLLTIGAEGEARYTVHYSDPVMVVSYVGQCLEVK
ncbi:hypothetical protein [Tropicibacter oceani]|uniref:Lipoprotein n=1 Tax=Tropicibacter oceani TaxID=3058420 RepID=A0ABY8QGG6_9RHOB|nr:hypothetical protein [Tropicibacter oceani]WGW02892.1 hypothetical protein QF118_13215 [Tropicibacter oceani]